MTTLPRRTRALAPRISRWLAVGAIALLATLATAQSAGAQATPEGTVITNTASASYTDANNNTYTAATASVSVTVGFLAGIDVASVATVSPASPSSANTLNFTIDNTGNGIDTVGTVNVTAAAGLTITGYAIGASHYANLGALQAALNVITIGSVNGTLGSSSTASIASGATSTINVVYPVANVAAGSTEALTLTATSQNDALATNPGDVTVRVVKAALAMTKVAYRDNQTTVINNTTDRVLPGEFIQYQITVTNSALPSASTVPITDALPAAVTYNAASGDIGADWSISQLTRTVTANLTPVLASAGSRFVWIRVQVK